MTATVYIAGPMSGIADWNFPAFFRAEEQLLALGYNVINPAHNDGPTVEEALKSSGPVDKPNNSWAYYMRRDLPHVMSADYICVLPGWQNSRGAKLEVHVANAIGIPLMILNEAGEFVPRVTCIGLSGYARTGKDTVANVLVTKYGYKKMSFADPIRESLERLNPFLLVDSYVGFIPTQTAVECHGWEELKTISPNSRNLMQRMGTEVGREMFGASFWIDQAIARIPDGSKVVFADVRFPNEADAIKSLNGDVWRISREGIGPTNGHVSETSMDSYVFDTFIKNDGSVEELDSVVESLLL